MAPPFAPFGRDTPAPPGDGHLDWRCAAVSFAYPGSARPVLHELSCTIAPGRCTAIIGPNGSGKSTLLRLLLGIVRPSAGTIELGGIRLERWSRRDLARLIGVVPQEENIAFPLSVRELVEMGRYPHLGPLRAVREIDRVAVDAALDRCDVRGLQARLVSQLSGGERQRARLARALAQEPRMLALDEPTRALDIRHEMEIFELVRRLVDSGVTAVIVTHNLNLAARYADTLILLEEGGLAGIGDPEAVLRCDLLERVYRWPLLTTRHPGPGTQTGAIQVTPLAPRRGPSATADP
jgi:iron complex transport system ATP-binding protein